MTRNELSPRIVASTAEPAVVATMASQNGTPPSTRRAANRAPRPAKAIWPRDSWPNHPVNTVSEVAQMAKASTSVKVCWVDGFVKMRGRTTAITANRNTPLLFRLRAQRKDRRRTGIGRALGVKAKTSLSSVRSRLKRTATTTVIKSNRLMSPGCSM